MSRNSRKFISLWIILCLFFTLSIPVAAKDAASPTHWASGVLQKWVAAGLLQDYSDGSLKPDNTVTRTEFLTILTRIFNYTDKSTLKIKDVPAGSWFADSISKSLAMDLVKADGDGNIKPQESITRLEAAVVIAKAFHLDAKNLDSITRFTDAARIPAESRVAVAAMVEKGYISGNADNTFGYARKITRAEAITMLDRVTGTLKKSSGTYSGTIPGNLVANTANILLKDMTIHGDLYLAQGIGNGDATLDNVKVDGKTYVFGGGINSIRIKNSTLSGPLIIQKRDGTIRIVSQGSTSIPATQIQSGVKLEEEGSAGTGFGSLSIDAGMAQGQTVSLSGRFSTVSCNTPGSSIQVVFGGIDNMLIGVSASGTRVAVGAGAAISNLTANSSLTVSGQGTIANAAVNAAGVVIEQKPAAVVVGVGFTATISGTLVTGTPAAAVPPSGTGGYSIIPPPATTPAPVPATSISGLISFDILPSVPTSASIQLKLNGSAAGTAIHPNDDCTYTLTGITAGTYTLEISLDGYKTINSASFVVAGNPITQNFTLHKKSVTGKIAIDSGTADLTQASLQLFSASIATGQVIHPDNNGEYCITGVACGTYDLEFSLTGYVTTTLQSITVANDAIADNGTTTLAARLAAISGTITFAAISAADITQASLQLKNGSSASGSPINPDANGMYTIAGIAPGQYSIEITMAGYRNTSIQAIQVAGADISGKDAVLTASMPTVNGQMNVYPPSAVPGDIEDIEIYYASGENLHNGTVVFTIPQEFAATTNDYVAIGSAQALVTHLTSDQISNNGKTITLTNINEPALLSTQVYMNLKLVDKVIPAVGTYNFSVTSDADGANTDRSASTGTGYEQDSLVTNYAPINHLEATAMDGAVKLTFQKPLNATSVKLEMSTNGISYTTVPGVAIDSSTTEVLVNGLINGTIYYFRLVVTGGNHDGISVFVRASPSKISASKSSAVINRPLYLNLSPTNPTSSTVTLTLRDSGGNSINTNETLYLKFNGSSSTTARIQLNSSNIITYTGYFNLLVEVTPNGSGICQLDFTAITVNPTYPYIWFDICDSNGNVIASYNNF